MSKIRLFIVDGSQKTIDKLENVIHEHEEYNVVISGSALNYKQATEQKRELKDTDVFLVAASLPDSNGIDLISYVRENFNKNAKFIITVGASTRNMVDEALDRGADSYLQKPFSPKDMFSEIEKVLFKDSENKKDEEEVTDFFSVEEETEADLEEDEEHEEVGNKKQIISKESERNVVDIFSNLGGKNIFQSLTSKLSSETERPNKVITFTSPKSNGKTTLLINAAAAIKQNSEFEPKVILVDLNLIYPALGVKLHQDDMNSEKVMYDIFDMLDEIEEIDESYLEKCVAIHEPTGIHILNTSLRGIKDVGKVTDKKVMQLIMFLREHYDLVMIDTNGYIRDETTIVPLTLSDANVIVIENELGNVFQTKRFVEIIQLIEKEWEKRILDKSIFVVNRYKANNKLTVENMKTVLFETNNSDIQIPVVIPEDDEAIKYSNFGNLLIEKAGPTTNKINELAMMLYPFFEEEGREFVPKEVEKNNSLFAKFASKLKK